jgi:protein-tyrosine phosphatase
VRRLQSDVIDAAATILFVCTGNICRSPMAEGLLRARLAARGVDAVVRSTGLTARGRPATDEAIAVAAAMGIDIRAHRSRVLNGRMIDDADLIVGLERFHVREVVLLRPDASSRAFTLKELCRRGDTIGSRAAGEPLARWLERAATGRRLVDLVGMSPLDDVADPFQRSIDAYQQCLDEIAPLVDRVVALAWPNASEDVA